MKNTVFYVRMTKIIENVKSSNVWENAPLDTFNMSILFKFNSRFILIK